MSFSSDIKKELCDVRELSPQQAEAMLYGIMYASRMDEGRPLIQTENIDLMNAAAELIRAVFPNVRTGIVRLVKNSGSLYSEDTQRLGGYRGAVRGFQLDKQGGGQRRRRGKRSFPAGSVRELRLRHRPQQGVSP